MICESSCEMQFLGSPIGYCLAAVAIELGGLPGAGPPDAVPAGAALPNS